MPKYRLEGPATAENNLLFSGHELRHQNVSISLFLSSSRINNNCVLSTVKAKKENTNLKQWRRQCQGLCLAKN